MSSRRGRQCDNVCALRANPTPMVSKSVPDIDSLLLFPTLLIMSTDAQCFANNENFVLCSCSISQQNCLSLYHVPDGFFNPQFNNNSCVEYTQWRTDGIGVCGWTGAPCEIVSDRSNCCENLLATHRNVITIYTDYSGESFCNDGYCRSGRFCI